MISIQIDGARQLANELAQGAADVNSRVYATTRHYGILLQSEVRSRARSLFHVTDYDREIQMRMGSAGMKYPLTEVGTDEPQGFRLERGFTNIDKLGRIFSQPPRPHFGPATARVGKQYELAIGRIVKDVL